MSNSLALGRPARVLNRTVPPLSGINSLYSDVQIAFVSSAGVISESRRKLYVFSHDALQPIVLGVYIRFHNVRYTVMQLNIYTNQVHLHVVKRATCIASYYIDGGKRFSVLRTDATQQRARKADVNVSDALLVRVRT